eukprot:7327200-Karenia_brevis.AAC.1
MRGASSLQPWHLRKILWWPERSMNCWCCMHDTLPFIGSAEEQEGCHSSLKDVTGQAEGSRHA